MAKKSRRARKAQTTKASATAQQLATQSTPDVAVVATEETDTQLEEMSRKAVSFTQDYYYVYTDIRILSAVTLVMVVVMFGLSYVF